MLTFRTCLSMAEDALAVVAGVFNSHPDLLVDSFSGYIRSRLGLSPVFLVELKVVLFEDRPSLLQTTVKISR